MLPYARAAVVGVEQWDLNPHKHRFPGAAAAFHRIYLPSTPIGQGLFVILAENPA